MAGTMTRTDPSGETIKKMLPRGTAGTAGAKIVSMVVVRTAIVGGTAGTANAGMLSWINPESGSIVVNKVVASFTTAGTGTFDLGVSSDGTGSNDNLINGGTLTACVVAAPGTTVVTGTANAWRLGPGGTGTNNSLVAKTSEIVATIAGDWFIQYYLGGS